MRICDLTIAYNQASGGIRTYIDQKRKHILQHTDHEHVLIAPGDADQDDFHDSGGRAMTRYIAGPTAPGHHAYHLFWRPDKIKQTLIDLEPDVVELGSFFISPWPAFAYRDWRQKQRKPCLVSGFFHTDIADAYVESPIEESVHQAMHGWSETLEAWGVALAETLAAGAESYFGGIFQRCDLMLGATPGQIKRLKDYGIQDGQLVPLGVDLEMFSPAKRDPAIRKRFGADDSNVILIYAGRLDHEKHVTVLTDAFERLPAPLGARLILIGEGPLRPDLIAQADDDPNLFILDYERDKDKFARLLASADIYVTAGPHETFGLSVVEGQASGLPVVGVAAGALTERVPEPTGLLGPVEDAQAMAENIQTVAANRQAMGPASRQHVEANLGWRATFTKLIDIYINRLQSTSDQAPQTPMSY